MYVEQEMYSVDSENLEKSWFRKPCVKIAKFGLWIYGYIKLHDSPIPWSKRPLSNESSASTVNVPSVVTVKREPSNHSIGLLLDLDDDICLVVNLSYISFFSHKTKTYDLVLVYINIDKTTHTLSPSLRGAQ